MKKLITLLALIIASLTFAAPTAEAGGRRHSHGHRHHHHSHYNSHRGHHHHHHHARRVYVEPAYCAPRPQYCAPIRGYIAPPRIHFSFGHGGHRRGCR